ncbi:MAG: GNAT family N-acetyltransferase [Anaerolineae bacterium]
MPVCSEHRLAAPRLQSARLDLIACAGALSLVAYSPQAELEAAIGSPIATDWLDDEARFLIGYYSDWVLTDPSQAGWGLWFLRERTDGLIIGSSGFKGKPDWHGVIEMGYGISPQYRRRGYATEAGMTLRDWAFLNPRVKRITAECLVRNTASRRVLENLGMTHIARDGEYDRWILDRSPACTTSW